MARNRSKATATILLSDLLHGLSDAAVERHSSTDPTKGTPHDRKRRRDIESSFNLKGSPNPKDGTPGVEPRALALIDQRVIRPRSVENGFTCADAGQVQANPSKWSVTLDEAKLLRDDLLPMRPGDIVVSALLLELGQSLANSHPDNWTTRRDEDDLPSVTHWLRDRLDRGDFEVRSVFTDAVQRDSDEVFGSPDGYYLSALDAASFREQIARIESRVESVRQARDEVAQARRKAERYSLDDAATLLVTSHHNPATCFRHIQASHGDADEPLVGVQEWPGLAAVATLRAGLVVVGASLGDRYD